LLKPVTQYGRSVPDLLDQLKEYEPRTRYRVRAELRDRPTKQVLAAIKKWTAQLDPADKDYEHHLCEALWVQQGHRAVDTTLLKQLLQAKAFQARAAATRVLADEFDRIPGAMALLRPLVNDEHPRVRLEAVRALSYVDTTEAAELALEVARKPPDYYLEYTLQHTMGALEPAWKPAYNQGDFARNNPAGRDFVTALVTGRPQLGSVARELKRLINDEVRPGDRAKVLGVVAAAKGKAQEGKSVFERTCVACHRIGNLGNEFGPDLSKVGERLKRAEIAESVLYPNEKVDPKYLATNITTKDGDEYSGLVTAEDDQKVTLVLGAGVKQVIQKSAIATREAFKVSSMPEGLVAGLAAQEFVDLIEYLASLK
jgi:putative heme-binding domain-containing protein